MIDSEAIQSIWRWKSEIGRNWICWTRTTGNPSKIVTVADIESSTVSEWRLFPGQTSTALSTPATMSKQRPTLSKNNRSTCRLVYSLFATKVADTNNMQTQYNTATANASKTVIFLWQRILQYFLGVLADPLQPAAYTQGSADHRLKTYALGHA